MKLTFPSGAEVILPPDAARDEWHAARRTGIGGSDMAAICGLNPYTSPLEVWLAKAGAPAPRRDDAALSEAALMGHALEPIVATRFIAITGLPVFDNPGTLRHPDHPWLIGNLDRATEEDGQPGGVEIKTRSSYALNDWADEPPVDTQVQVQTYLALTGWQFYYTACLIGGQRTIVHRIDRDEQMIADLLKIGEEFWGWVQNGVQPPIDGSQATGDLLDRLHVNPSPEPIVGDAYEVERWCRERARAKETIAAAETVLQDAENHLKHMAGDHEEVHILGERAYSWRQYTRRGAINWRDLAADHPDIDLDDYRNPPTTYRTLRVHLETS